MTNPDNAGGLLPCPFCGGEAERIDFVVGSGDNEGGSCIACTKCQASGPVEFGYKENFVSNWNRRAGELFRAAPAGGDDLYRQACDSVEEWKARALEAEADIARIHAQINAENGPTFMGEPVVSAPAGSGEVELVARLLTEECDLPIPSKESWDVHCRLIRRAAALLRKLQQPAVEETLRTLLKERNHRADGTLQELADRCHHLSRGDRDLIAMLRKIQQGADTNGDGNV